MSEWWRYRPSDFLMFSPRVYQRLFELVNEAWWPLHLLVLPAALLGLWALARGRGWGALGTGLGAAWLFSTVVFVHGRYVPIQWAAAYLLPALIGLAALLPLLGWQAGRALRTAAAQPAPRLSWGPALALAVWAVLLHPLLAPLAGRGWAQAEVLGFAPDPTAIATLALLLALPRLPTRLWRAAVALAGGLVGAWCLFSAFMLMTMENWQALVPGVGAVVAAGMAASAIWQHRAKCKTRTPRTTP
jgi:hypothetical protein